MSEEPNTDTQDLAPDQGQEGYEPEDQGEGVGEPEGQEAQAPPEPSPEDLLVEKATKKSFDQIASWMGRRDKALSEQIGSVIDNLRSEIYELKSGRGGKAPEPESGKDAFDAFVENPSRWLDMEIAKRQTGAAQRSQTIIAHAANLMESDPIFEDRDLGREVIGEMVNVMPSIPGDARPDVAAKLLVSEALRSLVRKRATTPKNPYAGKAPSGASTGGVKPPGAPAGKPRVPKLSPEVRKLAKAWNYSEEDLARLYGEK